MRESDMSKVSPNGGDLKKEILKRRPDKTLTALAADLGMVYVTLCSKFKKMSFTDDEFEKLAKILGGKYEKQIMFPDGKVVKL